MFTSVKISRNLSMHQFNEKDFNRNLGICWDATTTEVPISDGGSVQLISNFKHEVSYEGFSDIILAVKINRSPLNSVMRQERARKC